MPPPLKHFQSHAKKSAMSESSSEDLLQRVIEEIAHRFGTDCVQKAFRALDVDCSGQISSENIRQFFESMNLRVGSDAVDALMAKLNLNSSSPDKVDFLDIVKLLESRNMYNTEYGASYLSPHNVSDIDLCAPPPSPLPRKSNVSKVNKTTAKFASGPGSSIYPRDPGTLVQSALAAADTSKSMEFAQLDKVKQQLISEREARYNALKTSESKEEAHNATSETMRVAEEAYKKSNKDNCATNQFPRNGNSLSKKEQDRQMLNTLANDLDQRYLHLSDAFMKLDRDRSAGISSDELENFMALLNIEATPAAAQRLLSKCDVSGDGKISFSELAKALEAYRDNYTSEYMSEYKGKNTYDNLTYVEVSSKPSEIIRAADIKATPPAWDPRYL